MGIGQSKPRVCNFGIWQFCETRMIFLDSLNRFRSAGLASPKNLEDFDEVLCLFLPLRPSFRNCAWSPPESG
ncbi:MAG: hypothetical protein DMG56_15950 [Acidobacteria bacterium]|nr:MAG: hypothetical protein DMG56_15950 [Acidobacteriota bacterium]